MKEAVRKAKQKSWEEFGRKLDQDHQENIKIFWKKIKALRGCRGKAVRNVKNNQGKVVTEDKAILEVWRQHYMKQFDKGDWIPTNQTGHWNENDYDEVIEEDEVESAISKMKTGKAPGRDNIEAEFVKYGGPELVRVLQILFQKTWDEKRIPTDWEYNIIIPIHKKGCQVECSNYRPICLSPVVYKIYTSILERRLRPIVEHQIGEEQAGFRPGRQTQDHIFSIRNVLQKSWDRDKNMYLAFLDLKSAFDSVPREEIWNALRAKNVLRSLVEAIKSTYQEPKGVVRLNGLESDVFNIAKGVKQGDSLSPLLFLLFMDEVASICKRRTGRTFLGRRKLNPVIIQLLLYADDVVLIADSMEKLQQAVIEWYEELRRKGMLINTNKSKVLHVGRQQEDIHIYCNGEELEVVMDFTYLGAVIDRSGKVDSEITNRISKANAVYYQICNTVVGKKEVGKNVKLHIFKSVYLPILLYGAESWILTDRQGSRITAAEMKFLRRTAGKTRRDCVRNERIRQELEIIPLKELLETRQLKWYGHVVRMDDHRDPLKTMEYVPDGRRPRGRPRVSYLEYVEKLCKARGKDLRQARNLARNRDGWNSWLNAPLR